MNIMLIPAITKKVELLEKFSQEIYSEKYFWYCGYPLYHEMPDIKLEDNLFQYAIVNKNNKIVGFLTYKVDLYMDMVTNFGLYSFGNGDISVGIDTYNKLEELIKQYRRVEWCVVGGNKIKKNYDRFCKRHNGRILEFYDTTRDAKGNYHNTYVYEVLRKDKVL